MTNIFYFGRFRLGEDSEHTLECVIPEEISMETFTCDILGFPSSPSLPDWWGEKSCVDDASAVIHISDRDTKTLINQIN